MWTPDFGERGQRALKGATVLVSRVGGVGGAAAYFLAAAGVGRLIIAPRGNLKPADLNRQILMTHGALDTPRVECAARRLKELNPRLTVEAVPENISDQNAERLIKQADAVVDCAPLFDERFAMNRAAIAWRKPLIECAMYDFDVRVTSILRGHSPCLACLYPADSPAWKAPVSRLRRCRRHGRQSRRDGSNQRFFQASESRCTGRMLLANLREMSFQTVKVSKRDDCSVCGAAV